MQKYQSNHNIYYIPDLVFIFFYKEILSKYTRKTINFVFTQFKKIDSHVDRKILSKLSFHLKISRKKLYEKMISYFIEIEVPKKKTYIRFFFISSFAATI